MREKSLRRHHDLAGEMNFWHGRSHPGDRIHHRRQVNIERWHHAFL
jgi:hypothetical protein